MGQLYLPSNEIPQRTERHRRAQLEHVLIEEVGQKLTRIEAIVAALRSRSPSLSAQVLAISLGRIADLLAEAIRHCTTPASYFDQPLLPRAAADRRRDAAPSNAQQVSHPTGSRRR